MDKRYDASQIQVLKGLDPVRQNPGMYVGGTDDRGRHHLLWEAVDNAVDEHLAGHGKKIVVTLHADGSASVADEGRGIPVDMHETEKRSALEVVMTTLHAGGKFERKAYQVSGGLHGVGISVVNALSEWLSVTVNKDGHEWTQRYERGIPTAAVKKGKKLSRKITGTTVSFLPDHQMFPKMGFNHDTVLRRLREISFLEPGLTIELIDESTGQSETLNHPGGIVDYVNEIASGKGEVTPPKPVLFEQQDDQSGVQVRVAWQYAEDASDETIVSFANIIPTTEGGHHVSGFRTGMTRAINFWARKAGVLKDKDSNLDGADVRDGITAIVAVKMKKPQFEGQTKTRLGNPEVEGIVSQVVYESMASLLEAKPAIGRTIVKRAQTSREARDQAKAAAEAVRKKRPIEAMPAKLTDCSSKDPNERELYICEGDSAAGSAKKARNPRTQAILPIRGKVLNVQKVKMATGLRNEEIQSIVTAIGTGVLMASRNGDDGPEIQSLRYRRIIIMTDADVDGRHIQNLLLTLFFRYMRPLVEHGHVYIAQPPLYSVRLSRTSKIYAWDEDELAAILKKNKNGAVTRFKGLGEMDAPDLAATAMNVETRRVVRVTIDSMAEADRLFSELMGDDSGARRAYLDVHRASKIDVSQ